VPVISDPFVVAGSSAGSALVTNRRTPGNLTTYMMSGTTFAAAFFLTQEFQLARGYSPLGTGLRLLPFFATPMIVSPLAGALSDSDRIGRRSIMVAGPALQALGFIRVAARGSLATSWIELVIALLVAGIGISMALPKVPTAVSSAVAPQELGKASAINFMAQRFGTVFAIAIASAVFAANGHLGSPASVTAGLRPALSVGVRRVRRPGGADRGRHQPAAHSSGHPRRGSPAGRRLYPTMSSNHPPHQG
jgi:MFS family permease